MTVLIEYERHGQTFVTTPTGLVDELTYATYTFNRQRSPDITPGRWKKVFGEAVTQLERRYQQEQTP